MCPNLKSPCAVVGLLLWLLPGSGEGNLYAAENAPDASLTPAGPAVMTEISLGKCYGPFRSESYLEVAAALQALPEAERVAELRAWAARPGAIPNLGEFDNQVIILCQMLFHSTNEIVGNNPANGDPLIVHVPRENLGGPDERFGSLTLVDGIPFAMPALGGSGRGPMRAGAYLENCLKVYQWTSLHYQPRPLKARQQALEILLKNYPWKPPFLHNDKLEKLLAEQIGAYEPPPLRIASGFITGAHQVLDHDHPGDGPPELWEIVSGNAGEGIEVYGGSRPYFYTVTHQHAGGGRPDLIASGRGLLDVPDPFRTEGFEALWPSPDPVKDDWLIFKIVDAHGAEQSYPFRVMGPHEVEIGGASPLPWWKTTHPFLIEAIIGLIVAGGVGWYVLGCVPKTKDSRHEFRIE